MNSSLGLAGIFLLDNMPPSVPQETRRPSTTTSPPPPRGDHRYSTTLPTSPASAAAVGLSTPNETSIPPTRTKTRKSMPNGSLNGSLVAPACTQNSQDIERLICLELKDGTVYQGYSFGAERNVAGELVFQTGMVGYPESVTDPSYRGQILVITFPLVGNYGVPSRQAMDDLLHDLPKYFEASEIHIAGLVTASYCGEQFSHHLAASSLGQWLKEQGVPAMYGVDTRALTKQIREKGSMLGRMLLQKASKADGLPNGHPTAFDSPQQTAVLGKDWASKFESLGWIDPNTQNLVSEGESSSSRGVAPSYLL